MRENKLHEDQKYIDGLANNNTTVIKEIYVKFSSRVIQYINQNNGDAYHAQDVIQETIIAIYNQAKQQKLHLTCPFETYFFYLCKRKWLNRLKENVDVVKIMDENELNTDNTAKVLSVETSVYEQNHALYNEVFQHLDDACKEILRATFSTKPKVEVAKSLKINYADAVNQKVLCIGELTQLVQNAPKFNLQFY
ncbi:RNA polymerase sigma factor [Winogradskyella sediminis]|uniref:RNA polymerase sigma factor n=1 Tax=Winogradskyella sediminis TaxID=1382466 RepID=UPI000E2565B6|nr:sigma-70 family RNA polymerase sigma factor [Winogradskyella sediminis]REG89011.1 RNA polymerase sigma factor (sigma-70 family) [Winogradskyella sediminis]